MTPNKALSEQQYHMIKQNLPAYHIRALTGADNVDKWTTQELWTAFLTGVEVVVGTPAVLADALTHGFVPMSRLSLLVFDECHRCIKKDPMNKIMQNFYHSAKQDGDPTPHVLALSASPVMNRAAGKNSLQTIESNLDATTITPTQYRDELDAYVHPPKLVKIEFGESCPDQLSVACRALAIALASYDFEQDPYVLELQARSLQGDSKALRGLQEIRDTGKTYCTDQLKLLSNRARHINNDLGPQYADWYISTCVTRYLESRKHVDPLFLDLETKERRHLEGILKRVVSNADSTSTSTCGASNKAKALLDILSKEVREDLRSIVFVEQRAMVLALAQLLRCSGLFNKYRIGTFVGTSTFSGRASSLFDLFDAKSQAQDLKEFRDGSKNLMIATNVLEEGIDIPACNRVICFDLPKSLISFVQRRGRARQADSCYMLFVPQGDLQSDPGRWQGLEEEMKKAYMDENRAQDATAGSAKTTDEDEDDADANDIKYIVKSTGALLTLENARGHLHHFCAVATRHNSRYIDPRPEFTTEEHSTLKTWTASVALPSFVHRSIRISESSRSWRTEQAAIKDAAFSAYKALHQAELVNDNLLPAVKPPAPESGSQHAEQPSLVQVAKQWSMWGICTGSDLLSDPVWHASQITLRLSGREVLTQVLWLPFGVDAVPKIKLHWNAGVCYEAQIRPLAHASLDTEAHSKAADWTSLVLHSVFANSIPADYHDFALLLTRPDGKTAADFSGVHTGNKFISGKQTQTNDRVGRGILRAAGYHGRAYVLRDVAEHPPGSPNSTQAPPEMQLVVNSFPKRRSFLKIPEGDQAGAAYTSTQSFPVSQCKVDRLPIEHSILAVLLPSILHHIETSRVVQRLNATVLGPIHIKNPATVLEAISAPVAQEPAGDYNRLEYLGDSILKFCTELQLVAQHPTFPEAFLSAAKDNIVCNSNLAQASREAGLDQFIMTELFTGKKWQPPYLHELANTASATSGETSTREMSTKVLADVVEALIGAAFVDGGLHKAYTCIRTLLPKETWWDSNILFDTILDEATHADSIYLERLEKLVGHHFVHPRLLLEAITHASQPNNTVPSYERLEFFGDAVLDLIITPKLHAHARKLRHWDLHRIHEALVNGYFLGYCCMSLSGEEEIYDVVNVSSTRSPEMEARRSSKIYHLHGFLRASGQVLNAKQESIARFEALSGPIATALQSSDVYPWPDLTALQPDKFFSDIVEAILGAIYLDTRGDLGVCEGFLEKVGILPAMRSILDREMEACFPKERVGILADRELVEYKTERTDGEVASWECVVLVGQKEVTRVSGIKTKEEAEVRAADAAAYELGLGNGRRKRMKLSVNTRD